MLAKKRGAPKSETASGGLDRDTDRHSAQIGCSPAPSRALEKEHECAHQRGNWFDLQTDSSSSSARIKMPELSAGATVYYYCAINEALLIALR